MHNECSCRVAARGDCRFRHVRGVEHTRTTVAPATRTDRRSGQRREGVDTWLRRRLAACAACRCRGWCACGARADAPRSARCREMMDWKSAVISSEVPDSMGSEDRR